MAVIRDGNRPALVVIDMQNEVLANAWDREGVISRTATLVHRARSEGVPVIFIQHEDETMIAGSDGWQIVPGLSPITDDRLIAKHYPDAFEETRLEEMLDALGVTRLVIAGAQTDACIRATTHRALAGGYDMTLVEDCHTTDDRRFGKADLSAEQIVHHTNLCMQFVAYPGRVSNVVPHHAVLLATLVA